MHLEMGYLNVPHHMQADPVLRLASGPALEKRWRMPGEELREEHTA